MKPTKPIAALMVLAAGISSEHAWADTFNPPANVVYTLTNTTAARDAAVGTSLLTPFVNGSVSSSAGDPVTCPLTKTSTVNGTLVSGYSNVYQTSVPGVGIRFRYTSSRAGGNIYAPQAETDISYPAGSYQFTRGAEIIITGPVGSGPLTSLPSLTVTWTGICITPKSATLTLATNMTVASLTCSVSQSSVNVNLPSIPQPQLRPVGTTAGETAFSIGVNCANGGTSNVYMTLTDATDTSNRTNQLTLAPSSTAQGVKLQILRDGTPISFGPDSAIAGTQNQFSVGAANGLSTIDLSARYISTGVPIPGTANATATFTMSYQ